MISGIDYGKGNDESCAITFVSPEYIEKLQQENQKYKEVIDEVIDKLYCWGEALNPVFQKIMLDILKKVE